ncbi:MAG: GTPase Era [Pseudomonadota bacterium]
MALVGRPNVGKSTLQNRLLGMKLSITSRKPQTTRHNLLGVDTHGQYQALYVDTPGIHEPGSRGMNRYMVRSALAALREVDLALMIVERDVFNSGDELVLRQLQEAGVPALVALNKIDRLSRKDLLLPAIESLANRHDFSAYLPISAKTGAGVETLRQAVAERLPPGPFAFPDDQLTDQSERFLVAEIIREKLMRRLGEELPYELTVQIERYEERDTVTDIAANIYVEKPGQKQIVIGRKGEKLKSIGQEARSDIETLIDRKVMLRLWVKVRQGWSSDERALKRLGYGADK